MGKDELCFPLPNQKLDVAGGKGQTMNKCPIIVLI